MANPGIEDQDPDNPNAPSQNEYDAASGNTGNTTNPLAGQGMIEDEVGQERHDITSTGMPDVMGLRDKVNDMVDKVDPAAREQVVSATRHLSDAARQAQFGQHQGAGVAMGHAAGALGRAAESEPDPGTRTKLEGHARTAVNVGTNVINKNQVATPQHPLPVKQWKRLPVLDLESKDWSEFDAERATTHHYHVILKTKDGENFYRMETLHGNSQDEVVAAAKAKGYDIFNTQSHGTTPDGQSHGTIWVRDKRF